MKRVLNYTALGIGAFIFSALITIYAYPAIQTVAGLAVAQTGTLWNNLRDLAAGDDLTTGVMAAGCTLYDGTNFDRCRGDTANGLDVDVTRVTGSITVVGDNTPADNYANPTDALDTNTLLSAFDGSTWDRVRALANNADDVTVSTSGNLSSQSFGYEFDGTTFDRVRHSFSQSTAGVTTNAAGATLVETTTPMQNHTMQVDRTAGSTDAVEVDLQCSLDGTDFTQIATITSLVGEPVLATAANTACPNIRYNVVTVGAGNTLQIHLISTR